MTWMDWAKGLLPSLGQCIVLVVGMMTGAGSAYLAQRWTSPAAVSIRAADPPKPLTMAALEPALARIDAIYGYTARCSGELAAIRDLLDEPPPPPKRKAKAQEVKK